jgi:hypothetical protein
MKKHITLSFLLTFFLAFSITAQTVKTNEEGDKIVEYPDGTWRYLEPGEEFPAIDTPVKEQEEVSKKNNPKEQDAEFQARIQAIRTAEKQQRKVEKLQLKMQNLAQARLDLETELAVLRSSEIPDATKAELLERRVIKARGIEKMTRGELKIAEAEAKFFTGLIDMSKKKREKELMKYEEEKLAAEEKLTQTKKDKTSKKNSQSQLGSSSRPKQDYTKYSSAKDVILNPPKYKCNIKIDEVDEFTGKRRRTTESEILFTYTRDEVKPYYKDKDHTVCNANVTSMSGGIYVFSLEIAIASRTAKQEYGGILSNATLMVVLLDGTTISMINSRTDRGQYDAVRDVHTFQGNYQIPPKQVKDLIEGEIDKIRVVWEKGYDTYEIYEMDFLRNHLQCLID